MDWKLLVFSFGFCLVAVMGGIWPLLALLRKRAILDHPNHRSSHDIPTPKGAGLVIVPVLAIAWCWTAWETHSDHIPSRFVLASCTALFLCVISWLDDLKGLSPQFRLLSHAIAAGIVLFSLSPDDLIFQGYLPLIADRLLGLFVWIWFINLFNFMDGINGISGVQALTIACGVVILAVFQASLHTNAPYASAIAGAALGFLVWNWGRAKIFLGDVGSAPMGHFLALLLVGLAIEGEWEAALILPAYCLTDATVTLFRRILQGERFWEAHREHFYQQAVKKGMSHAAVASWVLVAGIVLIGAACVAVWDGTLFSFFISTAVVAGMVFRFTRRAKV